MKVSGFFEAQKKDALSLGDAVESGAQELGRWGYAWYYDLGAMSTKVAGPMDNAIQSGKRAYDNLKLRLKQVKIPVRHPKTAANNLNKHT